MHERPLSLSDRQLYLLRQAAKAIPIQQRENWLSDVAKRLTGEPSDAAVMQAINVQYDRTHVYLTDSMSKNT
jgi:hypothetical protein